MLSAGDAAPPNAAETGSSDAASAEDPTAAASSEFAAVPAGTGADLQQKHSNLVTLSSAGSSYTVSDFGPSRQTSPGGPWADSRPLGDLQPAEPNQVWLPHVLSAGMPSLSLVRHSKLLWQVVDEAGCCIRYHQHVIHLRRRQLLRTLQGQQAPLSRLQRQARQQRAALQPLQQTSPRPMQQMSSWGQLSQQPV